MRRVLVIVAAVAVLLGATAGVAAAAGGPRGNGADKAPMYQGAWETDSSCAVGAFTVTETYGFVVMNINAEGTLIGTVSLKGAVPNATYSIWIAGTDIPGQGVWYDTDYLTNCSQTPMLGYLTTDAYGNGNFKFKIDGVGPQGQVWVIAEGGGPRLQSPAVDLNYPNS